jgi:predicted nucleic acid-binding protein
MTVFVDTTALFALLDEDDRHHAEAAETLRGLEGTQLVTHTFVVAEAAALVGRHLPWAATNQLLYGILAVIDVKSIESGLYEAALGAYGQSTSPDISLVDRTSFVLMKALGISRAFTYDRDFAREGFELVA